MLQFSRALYTNQQNHQQQKCYQWPYTSKTATKQQFEDWLNIKNRREYYSLGYKKGYLPK